MAEREDLRRRKRWRFLRETGRPSYIEVGPETLRLHRKVVAFHERGMAFKEMATQTGLSVSAVYRIAKRDDIGMWRSTVERLEAMTFAEGGNARVDRPGTSRRLRAMWADGFPATWLSERLGTQHKHVLDIIHQRTVRGHFDLASRVSRLYEECDGVRAEDVIESKHSIALARLYAGRHECAPRHCWDPDTIDDPDGIPEWTGLCGTWRGYNVHVARRIPPCQPCRTAIAEYNRTLKGVKE